MFMCSAYGTIAGGQALSNSVRDATRALSA